jgi:2-polyprenyl-3-methyl-5-hydroxy-6-metoxy-1,4-benzoquinol methylase
LLLEHIEEAKELTEAAESIPSLLPERLDDTVTSKVATHYETHPYPRWLSLHRSPEMPAKEGLQDFFGHRRPAFLGRPINVLVAGAGTGRQAVDAAYRYGPHAKIVAIDLSRTSLAYGQRMAKRLGMQNIEFIQADLHKLDALREPFDIIECIGVMHHTPDVFSAWSSLLEKLSPEGLMAVGLYSAVSRGNIAELRGLPNAPGPSVSNQVARDYRASLIDMDAPEAAKRLWRSEDFYSLNEFRDLVLHPNEIQLTLPDITNFLQTRALVFCGFLQPSLWAFYRDRFPEDAWPGNLDRWWSLEQENPSLFDSMYQFWCRRG